MQVKKENEQDRIIELLEKSLVFQLFVLGVPQLRIAKILAKKTNWVNDLLKGIQRKNEGKK